MEDNSRFEDIFDKLFTGTPKARFYKENYEDHTRSPTSSHVAGGFTIYDDAIDGGECKSCCHGFAWANDRTHYTHRYRDKNLA